MNLHEHMNPHEPTYGNKLQVSLLHIPKFGMSNGYLRSLSETAAPCKVLQLCSSLRTKVVLVLERHAFMLVTACCMEIEYRKTREG